MRKKETQISTIIGMGAVCNGDFTSDGSVRIDGTVIGNVTVTDDNDYISYSSSDRQCDRGCIRVYPRRH